MTETENGQPGNPDREPWLNAWVNKQKIEEKPQKIPAPLKLNKERGGRRWRRRSELIRFHNPCGF